MCLCVQGNWLEQCVSCEPEVLWVDIDKLLLAQNLPQQRADGVSNELEAELVMCIIHGLIEVR